MEDKMIITIKDWFYEEWNMQIDLQAICNTYGTKVRNDQGRLVADYPTAKLRHLCMILTDAILSNRCSCSAIDILKYTELRNPSVYKEFGKYCEKFHMVNY